MQKFARWCLAVFLGVSAASAVAALPNAPKDTTKGSRGAVANFDARVNHGAALRAASAARPGAQAALQNALPSGVSSAARARSTGAADFKSRTPEAVVEFAPGTLAPETVYGSVPLTAPSSAPAFDIARNFLRSERAMYGLSDADIDTIELIGVSPSPTGLTMVRMRQVYNGRPVFGSETRVLIDREGRILRTLGALVPDLAASVEADAALISAADALVNAMGSVGIALDASQVRGNVAPAAPGAAARGALAVSDARIRGDVTSELVYFPLVPGLVVPAWQQVAFTQDAGSYLTLVDAASNTLVWRKNIQSHASTQEARFSVYVQADGATPTSPAPHSPTTQAPGAATQYPAISRTTVNMSGVQNLTASRDGWIPDGATTTTGNNVDAYLDAVSPEGPDTGALDNNGRPIGNPDSSARNRDFLGSSPRDYTYTPAPWDPTRTRVMRPRTRPIGAVS